MVSKAAVYTKTGTYYGGWIYYSQVNCQARCLDFAHTLGLSQHEQMETDVKTDAI